MSDVPIILGQLGPNPHTPTIAEKVPIMGHTLRRDAVPPGLLRSPTRSCARWCPTIFNDYGLGIVLQPPRRSGQHSTQSEMR